MPFAGLLTAGLGAGFSGLAGLFGGGKQQKVQTSGTISNTGTQSQSGTSASSGFNTTNLTHNLSPLQLSLIGQFTKGAGDLFNQANDLSGYRSEGLKTINQNANLADKVLQNSLAARGLTYSPAAANAITQGQINRVGQQSQFENQLPLLQRQLQESALGDIMKAFQLLPTDTTQSSAFGGQTASNQTGTSSSTQTQQGTNLVSGNPLTGLFGGLGSGFLVPGGLSDILSSLFGSGGGLNIPLNTNISTTP